MLTMSSNIMSFAFHSYQAELYPTRIRAVAVGFVYSFSRISVVFSAFVIAFFLRDFGTIGVFSFIAGSMVIVMALDRDRAGGEQPRARGNLGVTGRTGRVAKGTRPTAQ